MSGLARTLSGPEFEELLAELRGISGAPTLEQIRDVMIKYGIKSPTSKDGNPSLKAATTLRDGPFRRYIERINAGREAREQLCTASGAGVRPIDAIEEMTAVELQDHFMSGEPIDIDWVTKQLVKLRSSISMREESQRKQRDLERRNRETEKKLEVADQQMKLRDEQIARLKAEAEAREEKNARAKAALQVAKSKGGITKETLARIEEAAALL